MSDRFTTSIQGGEAASAYLRGVNDAIDSAVRDSISKATRSATSRIRKGLAKSLGATEGAIKRKKRITSRIMRNHGLVWIGVQPLLPTHLGGKVTQSATGVSVGNHTFIGAFHKAIYTQDKKVWIRLRSRHYDADLYPYKGHDSGHLAGALSHRFPVVLGRVKVDTDAIRAMVDYEADQARELLADLVAQKLGAAIGTGS